MRPVALILVSARSRADHLAYRSILRCLYPGGVAVDVLEDHLVCVASAGDMWELSGLVSMNGIFLCLCVFLLE